MRSRTQSPTFFDEDLNPIGTLGGGQQMFVTQMVRGAVYSRFVWIDTHRISDVLSPTT